jgi:hypothetical protein
MEPTTDPTKPGYLTSEFWTNVLTIVISGFVGVAALFGHHLDGSNLQPLIGLGALIGMGISAAYYSHSRGTVKAGISHAIAAMPTPEGVFDVTDASNLPSTEDSMDDASQEAAQSSRYVT